MSTPAGAIHRMRAEGATLQQIATHHGITIRAVRKTLDPERYRTENQAENIRRRAAKTAWDRKKAAERKATKRAALGITPPEEIPGTLPLLDRDGREIGRTLVDLGDWHVLKHHRFTLNRQTEYVNVSINGERHYLHRYLLGLSAGMDPKLYQADHINRDKLDNRRANLRIVTAKENCANRGGIYTSPKGTTRKRKDTTAAERQRRRRARLRAAAATS